MKSLTQKEKMFISALTGFSFFLVANFTTLFQGSSLAAGVLQICINIFVFLVWLKAFRSTKGFTKFVAFFGIAIPFLTGSITIWRVLIPLIF